MSHVLSFYAPRGRVPGRETLVRALAELPYTTLQDGGDELVGRYENPFTGVDGTFAWRREPEEATAPPGVEPVGLVAQLDYLRPRFCALELLAQVEALSRRLGLLVADPQAPEGSAPALPAPGALRRSWEEANRRAVWTVCTQEPLQLWTAPRARLEAWWRAAAAWPRLRARYGDELGGPPRLVALEREVRSLLFWEPGRPGVFPGGLDGVLLRRERRRLRVLALEEVGLVPAAALLEVLAPGLVREEEPVPHHRLALPWLPPGLARALARLPVRTRGRWVPVPPSRLVDAEVVTAGPPV